MRWQAKPGECFRNALKLASELDGIVVHGKVAMGLPKPPWLKMIDHAWVEKDGIVYDPTTGMEWDKEAFYNKVNRAVSESRYTVTQATRNSIRTGKHGPWTAKEVGDNMIATNKLRGNPESSPRRVERARKALARDRGVAPEDLKYIGDQEGAHAGRLGTHLFNIMDPSHPNYKSTVGWPMDRTIETTQGEIMSIWTEVKARGIPYDNHESDLYIPVNDETRKLLRGSGIKYSAFYSSKDHTLWYDIPFAYEPWWEKRTGNRMRGNPWKGRVRDTYSTLEELEVYDETYGIVKRLGYRSARGLWDANPVIGGSVHPEDLRVMRRGERLPRRGTHLPPAKGNPKREFEECGSCGQYHPSDFHGDCRDDKNRYTYDRIPGGSIVWEQDERGRWVYCTKEKWEEVSSNPMKLMTKEIERKAMAQYPKGNDLENQMVVAKFFDPQGSWSWYLMNIDPEDPDYCWGIVSGHEIEIGSFSLSELQSVRGHFGLGIERDLYFHPLPAKEAWDRLNAGEHI